MLRMRIEDYEANSFEYPFGLRDLRTLERARKEIQCQKERVATYLAGSRQGIPPLISRREGFYLRKIYFTLTWERLRRLCRQIPDGLQSDLHGCFSRQNIPFLFAFGCILILWILFSIQFGRWRAWNDDLYGAARAIMNSCKSFDLRKWWRYSQRIIVVN
jgi:hypothetical protein